MIKSVAFTAYVACWVVAIVAFYWFLFSAVVKLAQHVCGM